MKKKFIVLEGGDGVGKSTCALEMAKVINGIYYKTPPPIFDNLRKIIKGSQDYNLQFYYFLTGVIYSSREIAGLLKSKHVVCDRYLYTTIAYYRTLGVIIPDGLEKLVLRPDHCFCLHVCEDTLRKRMSKRPSPSVLDNAFDFQKKFLKNLKALI